MPFTFKKEMGTRVGLLPTTARSADEMTWFQLPGHVVLHVGNAWQADGKVHVYVAGFKEFHMRVDKGGWWIGASDADGSDGMSFTCSSYIS